MSDPISASEPMEFMRNMWGQLGFSLPGMVTPTLDMDELEKRIKDLKAVEGWLRMNLSMLQLTIQGLEMQHTTLGTVRAMGNLAQANAPQAGGEQSSGEAAQAFTDAAAQAAQAALWPLNLMNQMQSQFQSQVQEHLAQQAQVPTPTPAAPATAAKAPARKSTAKTADKATSTPPAH